MGERKMNNKSFNIFGNFEKCPICGYEFSHIEKVVENDELSSNNQGNVSIYFWGECGHKWIRIFSGHKGNVSKGTVVITEYFKCIEGE
jgi:hypothetical protein